MPTTTVGLVLFVVILAPGLTYRTFRAASTPDVKLSPLTEVGTVALQSVVWNLVALTIFGVARLGLPDHTPDVGALLRDSHRYLTEQGVYLFWWSAAVLALACTLAATAATAASSDAARRARSHKVVRFLLPRGTVTPQSAWWVLFHERPDTVKHVSVTLNNGYWLSGTLRSYSPNSDETADRELTLSGPIRYRSAEGAEGDDLGVGAVAVSARSISHLTVSYVQTP